MQSHARTMAMIAACWALCSYTGLAAGQVLPDAVQACRKEADDARRLQCFDRETAKYPLTAEQSLGLQESRLTALQNPASGAAAPPRITQLTARVAALRERPHAGFVVTLDNGQIWAQNEMEAHQAVRVGDVVTIKPAKLGGFWLVGPSGWSTRVRRMQ
jgi:hypothetical protein